MAVTAPICIAPTDNSPGLMYNLLRCSTNFNGPTDNFQEADLNIVSRLNSVQSQFFSNGYEFNHVLAQIYHNTSSVKATIKSHSDKTKDMPTNGMMAFCTFYDEHNMSRLMSQPNFSKSLDGLDHLYKKTSILTKIVFTLKKDQPACYPSQFDITLFPNSVFMIPLSTNRLYTHRIKPSGLPFDKIPTRMGYVVRCSNTQACYIHGKTHIVEHNTLIPLVPITPADEIYLKHMYYEENMTSNVIQYEPIYFSMNNGDYMAPNTKIDKKQCNNNQKCVKK